MAPEPLLPSVATLRHPINPLQHLTVVLYVRTFDEFLAQIAMLKLWLARHALN